MASFTLRLPQLGIAVRPFRDGDEVGLQRHLNSPAVLRHLRNRIPRPYTAKAAREWIRLSTATDTAFGLRPSGSWDPATGTSSGPLLATSYAIVAETGTGQTSEQGTNHAGEEVIGSITLCFGDAMDVYCRSAELGYWLAEEWWGRGVMSTVARELVAWAFKTWDVLWRVEASVAASNEGSRRVLEKAGLTVEGCKRGSVWKHGQLTDEIIMAALRST